MSLPIDLPRIQIDEIDEYKSKLSSIMVEADKVNQILADVKQVADVVADTSTALSIAIAPLGGTPFVDAIREFSQTISVMSGHLDTFTSSIAEATTFDINRLVFSEEIIATLEFEKDELIALYESKFGPIDDTLAILTLLDTPLNSNQVLASIANDPAYLSNLIAERKQAIATVQKIADKI